MRWTPWWAPASTVSVLLVSSDVRAAAEIPRRRWRRGRAQERHRCRSTARWWFRHGANPRRLRDGSDAGQRYANGFGVRDGSASRLPHSQDRLMLRIRHALGQAQPPAPTPAPAAPSLEVQAQSILSRPWVKIATVGFIAAGTAKAYPGKFVAPFVTGIIAALMTGVVKDPTTIQQQKGA